MLHVITMSVQVFTYLTFVVW